MDEAFARSLDEWTAFYALMGGVAGTLLGLLFVSVSLRLNIFRQREVADVRDFAAFTFGTFLVAIVISGMAIAPHKAREPLAAALLLLGLAGVLAIIWISRVRLALNARPDNSKAADFGQGIAGWVFMFIMSSPYLGLLAVAIFLWRGHPAALGLLAIVEAWLLGLGTVAAWILLSHAGREQ